MSLFKVSRGSESNLPSQKTDGWAYFCTDTGSFWIDHKDANNVLVRSKISANFADKLRYIENGATIELDPSEIATKTYVDNIANGKVDKINGKGLSTNDLTNALKQNYDAAYTHSQEAHAPAGAQANIIESIKVNGTAQTITNKAINITVPTGALASKSKVSESDLDTTLATKLNGMIDVTELDSALFGKQDTITGAATTITGSNLTANRALIANASGKVAVSDITSAELGYLDGVTSNIQTQLNGKAAKSTTLAGYGITDAYTDEEVDQKFNDFVAAYITADGGTIDKLNEIASWIADDDAGAAKIVADVAANTQKLDGIEAGADVNIIESVKVNGAALTVTNKAVNITVPTYSTTAPVMDGTASVGSASTVARSDHKHPTDTSRAAQTDLDTHTVNTTIHITSDERTKWNAAKTHADSAHAPSNAEKNQNAFSNVVVGSTTIAADNATDSLTIAAGTGISVSGDATNDKVTITNSGVRSIATGSTNGTISVNTNGTSAEVAVKGLGSAAYTASTAYDAAGTATAKASTALGMAKEYTDQVAEGLQASIDGKANSGHTHTVANITDLTATATEINYLDGVTSNVQAQLDGKSLSGHKHSAADMTSGTLSSDRLPTVPISKGGTGATTAAAALTNLGITATAAELNKLDGITATTAELNYVDGVTSNIQTQLNGKAASGHTHDNLVCSTIDITNGASKNRTSGYVKLNNGMILQWGTVQDVVNETTTAVNFPIAFPNSVGGTVMLTGNYSGSYGYELHANNVGLTGFNIIKKGGSTTSGKDAVSWLVVGW